jgi:hypothetical protein
MQQIKVNTAYFEAKRNSTAAKDHKWDLHAATLIRAWQEVEKYFSLIMW